MSTLHHEIFIRAPLQNVWRVLADLESARFTNPMVKAVRIISPQSEGVGAARECELVDGSFVEERVSAFDAHSASIGFELAKHQWPLLFMRWTTTLRSADGGTMMISDSEYESKFGVIGRVMDVLFMRRKLSRAIADAFEKTRVYLE